MDLAVCIEALVVESNQHWYQVDDPLIWKSVKKDGYVTRWKQVSRRNYRRVHITSLGKEIVESPDECVSFTKRL
jgi:hypothetical protein